MNTVPLLLTVGHSNHEGPAFLDLLQSASVTAVADVRSSPFSRRLPQFNRAELERALGERGIGYVFLGDLLGGRPREPHLYGSDSRVDYELVRATPAFQRGLDRLLLGLQEHRVALLCAEEDPLDCHRGLMITPALAERGVQPLHLRRDGTLESTEAMEARLLAMTGVGEGILDGLFAATVTEEERRELLAEAYRKRARGKAYRQRPEAAGDAPEEEGSLLRRAGDGLPPEERSR